MKRIYGCVLGTFLILLFFQTVGCSGPSIEFSEEPVEAEGTIKLVLLRKGFTEFSMEFFLVAEPNVYNLNINQTCETHTGSDAAITTGSGFLIGSCGKYFLLHSDATYKVKGIPEKEGVVLSTRPTIPLKPTHFDIVQDGIGTIYAEVTKEENYKTAEEKILWSVPSDWKVKGIVVENGKWPMGIKDGREGWGDITNSTNMADWIAAP